MALSVGADLSDKELFESMPKADRVAGRPQVDRKVIWSLLAQGKSVKYITRTLGCSSRTVTRAKDCMPGEIRPVEVKPEDDFNLLCKEAHPDGLGLREWLLLTNKPRRAKATYNFCKKTWEKVLGRPHPSVFLSDEAGKLAVKVRETFAQVYPSPARLKRRLKTARYLFRFFGRMDLCDQYLRVVGMPDEVREIPQIAAIEFPRKLDLAIEEGAKLIEDPEQFTTLIHFKIATLMRTGNFKEERELYGLKKGSSGGTYLTIEGEQLLNKISSKGSEEWHINYLPPVIETEVKMLYEKRADGEPLFILSSEKVIRALQVGCEKAGIPKLILHDLRKVGITWLWVLGIPLEIAVSLNVGWKDLNTAKKHYLTLRGLLRKDQREQYAANLPAWFRGEWDQFKVI